MYFHRGATRSLEVLLHSNAHNAPVGSLKGLAIVDDVAVEFCDLLDRSGENEECVLVSRVRLDCSANASAC